MLALGGAAWQAFNSNSTGTLSGGENIFFTVSTSSAVTVGITSTFLLATSTERQYCAIVNDGSNPIYLSFNDVPAVANSGLRLNASGGSFEIDSNNLYKGALRAIASGGTSVTTVTCKE